jgi:hypothetical protein
MRTVVEPEASSLWVVAVDGTVARQAYTHDEWFAMTAADSQFPTCRLRYHAIALRFLSFCFSL